MINQKIETNLIPGHVNPRISVSQFDKNSRTLQFALYNGNTAYNIVSGTTALIQGTKPDKHAFQYVASVTVGSNIVTATLTEQMTAVAGDVLCEIVLNKGTEKLATANFILDVEKAALGDDSIHSDSELPLIIALATEQMEAAAASATLAQSYAKGGTGTRTGENTDNAKYYKEQAASSASSASSSATTATNKATAAAGSATLAESYAKGGTGTRTGENTDNAKYYKEQAASSSSSAASQATAAAGSATLSESYAKGGTETRTGENTDNSKYYKEQAAGSATAAAGSASTASTKASNASASATLAASFAKGGTGTRSGEDTDNAKYYKEHAANSASSASSSESIASGKASDASASATLAESYTKGGTGTRTGEDTDNSKYYKEHAASSASSAQASADRAQAYSVNVPYIGQNGNWWIWDNTTGAYVDSGVDASITLRIADITMLNPDATPYVTNTGTDTDPIFHLFIPRGKGISSIAKTSTSGLVDTYTITYSDGNTTTFQVTNGKTAYQSAVEGGYAGTEAEFEQDLANFGPWAESAHADAATAGQAASDAQASADLAAQYAEFITPHFIIQNNRLYIKDDAVGEFITANNRLYIKLAS